MRTVSPETAILLFSCPDARGIVAEVSSFIFSCGGNILESSQHNEPETNTFFMRVAWDLSEFTIAPEEISEAFRPIAQEFRMDYQVELASSRHRLCVFVSKQQHCLYDLLLRNMEGEIRCDIAVIIGNHPDARSVAEFFGVPFYHVPVAKADKAGAEQRQLEILQEHEVDLVVLARYMQILSGEFVARYPNRIINIHHSFLPAFVGARPYHQAYERGVKIIGATSHYATAELDQGPIIEQDVVRISHRDHVRDLVRKGRNLEKLVLSKAVQLHLEHRVLVFQNKTIVFE